MTASSLVTSLHPLYRPHYDITPTYAHRRAAHHDISQLLPTAFRVRQSFQAHRFPSIVLLSQEAGVLLRSPGSNPLPRKE